MTARPTNSWFANLLYGTGREMVAPLPYHCKVTASGIDVCVPNLDTAAFPTAIIAVWAANLSLGSTAAASATQKVTGFTDLGCTVTWSSGMTCDLVRGAAYVTMRYTALTPVISTAHAVTEINGIGAGSGSSATGTKFRVTLNNGQNWLAYFSSSTTLTLSGSQTLTASAPLTGTVRIALSESQAQEDALDASAACIPTGGTATMALSAGTYTKTLTYATTGTGTLLTYAMPHHQDTLVSPTYAAATMGSLRGSMRGVLGSTWNLTMPAAVVGEQNKNPIDSTKLSAVTTALTADKTFVPTTGDPYFGGKSLAKAARLISIANQVGDTAARDTLLTALKPKMADYFALLRYETNKGGIVSLVGLTNGDADFGNGYYNDHYFHYGYTIYAASVIARYDSAWSAANLDKVNALVRDICNPSSDDPYFTPFRHWDHFEGHSWASGYPAATDGRNQESTSEAVNAWWGVQQWGSVTSQPKVAQLGTMLMTEEILTARKYWQVKQAGTVYPTSAFKTNGCVGILWSNKVDHGTWFSSAKECIFGIQMLPTNPTTEALIDPAWISEVWTNNLSSIYAGAQEPWKGPLVGAYAQVNPADAWTKVNALTAWDDGTSKTQMLYHVATQVSGASVATAGWWSSTLAGVPVGSMGASRDDAGATAVALRKQWDYWDQTGGSVIDPATDGIPNPPGGANRVIKWQKPGGTAIGTSDQVYQKMNRTFTQNNWPAASSTTGNSVPAAPSPADISGQYVTHRYLPSSDLVLNPNHGWLVLMSFKENYRDSGGGFHQDGTGWKVGGDNIGGGPVRISMTNKASVLLSSLTDRWVRWEYRIYQGAKDTTGHGGRIEWWLDGVLIDTGYEGDVVEGTPTNIGHIGPASYVPIAQTEGLIWTVGQYTSNQTTGGVPDYVGTHMTSYIGPSWVAPI